MNRAPDVVGAGAALEHVEQVRTEALGPDGHAVDAGRAQQPGEPGRHRLGIRLDGDLVRGRKRIQQAAERLLARERGRAPADEDRLQRIRKDARLERQLRKQRIDVLRMLVAPADERDEVAVTAPVCAERQVDVEMPDAHVSASSRRRG